MSADLTDLPPNTTLVPSAVNRLTTTTTTPCSTVISRFRALVPPYPVRQVLVRSSAAEVRDAINSTLSQAGTRHPFVFFNEFDHGRWIKLFPAKGPGLEPDGSDGPNAGRALHRFIFGNPLFAITMIQEDVEAGLCVPIEILFVEQEQGTRCVMLLPGGLIAGHPAAEGNHALKSAVVALEQNALKLIEEVMR